MYGATVQNSACAQRSIRSHNVRICRMEGQDWALLAERERGVAGRGREVSCFDQRKLRYVVMYQRVTLPITQWLLYVPPGLTLQNSTFCPHSVFMCFVWI